MAVAPAINQIALSLEELPDSAAIAIAKLVKKVALQEGKRVTGDLRVSNVGKRGTRLNVRDDFKSGTGQATVTVYGTRAAVWSWFTDGTTAHLIGAGRTGGNQRTSARVQRSRRKRRYLAFGPDEVRYPPVWHGGMRKLGVWNKVTKRSNQLVPALFDEMLSEAVDG